MYRKERRAVGVKRFDRKRRRNELVVLKDVVCWRVVVKTSSPPDGDVERENEKGRRRMQYSLY